MDDPRARPPRDPRDPAGAPSVRQRWAALAGQQQAVIILTIVAVLLMIAILIVLLTSNDDDDAGAVATVTPTVTAEATEEVAEPTDEPAPEDTPVPEPTATLEPEPTPEPEPTATLEPTPEPEPTATLEPTPEPEPTATPEEVEPTPEPEPTQEPEPEPVSGSVDVEDPENDLVSADGQQPPAAIPLADLRSVELEIDDDDEFQIRFRAGDNIPDALDGGIIATWTLIVWIEDQESYRVRAGLENDQWTVTLLDVEIGQELPVQDSQDTDDEELEIVLPLSAVDRLTVPFAWAAIATIQTADGQVYGDNLPDAGDTFVEVPELDQRSPFPE